MIAYLIHCSIVWLLALLVYEIWLRRTTFHDANRWYLDTSALLGLLLPLWRPERTRPDLVPALEPPMHAIAVRQQQLEVIGQNAGNDFHLSTVLLILAVAGTAFQLLRLIREGITLLRWRRRAVRTELLGLPVLITGAPHGPFSAFGSIYLSDTGAYTEAELRFILAHEKAHLALYHSIDKSFMLLLRCLFWWHPLVYVFYSRLSLVQEFQADRPLRRHAPAYGRFLIEESLAADGVSITHPFFHSPLKTRIRMLQRFATRNWQKAGYVAALTLLAGGSFLWMNKSLAHSEEKQGKTITFNGNKFDLGYPPIQLADGSKGAFPAGGIQVRLVAPQAGAGHTSTMIKGADTTVVAAAPAAVPPGDRNKAYTFRMNERPVRMNGIPILSADEPDQKATLKSGSQDIAQYLIETQMPSLSKLPDGNYHLRLSNVIADADGTVVYYENGGVIWYVDYAAMPGSGIPEKAAAVTREEAKHPVNPALASRISDELEAGLQSLKLNPATKSGKPVIAYAEINGKGRYYTVRVRDGKVVADNVVR